MTPTSPLPLSDLLTDSPPSLHETPGDQALADRAERLAEFALAERERIEELDISMGRIALQYKDPQGAFAMRRLYQQWADQAAQLLDRIIEHGLRGRVASKFDLLERKIGVTLAMLSITLDSLQRSTEQIGRSETVSIEEVRRELRA